MTDFMVSLFIDVHPSNAKLTLFCDSNGFFIASKVSDYSLQQILLRVMVDSSTGPLCNAVYDRYSQRVDIAFCGI